MTNIRQRKSYKLTQGFGNMKGVYRKPSDIKRKTQIGTDVEAPSELYGDELTVGGEDKHLMQMAGDESIDADAVLDAADYISQRDAGWSNYDQETKSFY